MSNIDDKLFDITSESLKDQDVNQINREIDLIEKYKTNTYPYKDRTIFLPQNNNKNKQINDVNKQKNDINNKNNKYKYILIIIILSICLIVVIVIYLLESNCINTCIKKIKSKN